jgi:hypothetical protein
MRERKESQDEPLALVGLSVAFVNGGGRSLLIGGTLAELELVVAGKVGGVPGVFEVRSVRDSEASAGIGW